MFRNALNEKDVENKYRNMLLKGFRNSKITSPHNSDGLLEYISMKDDVKVRTLLEFKHNLDLKDGHTQAGVLVQALYYLKRFEENGQVVPTTLFVGDNTECFAMRTTVLKRYLEKEVDWSIAPSNASKLEPNLVRAIVDDEDITPFVFNTKGIKFDEVINKIKELSEGLINLVNIDETNIVESFRYWREHVLKDTSKTVQEEVNIFVKCLVDRTDTYEHPRKSDVLVTTIGNVNEETKVNIKLHNSFFKHFKQNYKPSEREGIVANKDRLVEEVERRKTGEFFTPSIWAAEAHIMLDDNLGEDWTKDYVVWDCASGTNNLTRDRRFKELYCSTLNAEDLDTAQKMGYNPEANFFQFDFLNDDDSNLPEGLQKALKDDKVLFLINPPYGSVGTNKRKKDQTFIKGTVKTNVNEEMKEEGWGSASSNLYTQFLYKISKYRDRYKNKDINIGVFCPPDFLTNEGKSKFRRHFLTKFSYKDGYLMDSSSFADVKSWGLAFSVFTSYKKESEEQDFRYSVKDIEEFKVKTREEKVMYNLDKDESMSSWLRDTNKGLKNNKEVPNLKSALNVSDKMYSKYNENSLGSLVSHRNSVMDNAQDVYILTLPASRNVAKVNITKENIRQVAASYTSRRVIKGDWVNWYDEYLKPNETLEGYKQWNNDTLVYMIFESKSNQSALRGIDFKEEKWDIKNEFFFISNEEMLQLADEHDYLDMYNDARYFNEDRYMYTVLKDMELSKDARGVLDKARELTKKSMKYREESHMLRPEFNLNAWDSGWYQIRRGILTHYPELKEEYDEFVIMFKEFEERMSEGVYDYGFLKK